MANPKGQQPASPTQWLEEELREAKARLHKVEGELDQALKQIWTLGGDLQKLTEALAAAGSAAAALAAMKDDVRQLRDQLSRLQDRQTALGNRTEEALRQHQTEAGRERQEKAALAKQMDALAKAAGQYESRIQAADEASRHLEEEIAGVRLTLQGLARDQGEVSSRTARNLEAAVRLEHEVSRAHGEIDSLRKQDEVLAERLNLVLEQIRRHGERLDKLDVLAAFPLEAREMLQRATVEREQMTERLRLLERASGELTERAQEFAQALARQDQRGQMQSTQLLAMTEQLQDLTDQTKGQIKRLVQVFLRQRRRQVEALSQEIKELSHNELNSKD